MPARFDGRVALVIGGSSGIGLATVRGLLAEGAQVSIAARGAERLDTIGRELLATHPGRVAWVSGDIAQLGEAERLVAATLTRFGRLDILVTSSALNYSSAIAPIRTGSARSRWDDSATRTRWPPLCYSWCPTTRGG